MRKRALVIAASVLPMTLILQGCLERQPITDPPIGAIVQFVNATERPLDVLVDGQRLVEKLPSTMLTQKYVLQPGERTLGFRDANGRTATITLAAKAYESFTTVGRPAAGAAFSVDAIADTNALPVAGKGKLRVVHLAPNAPAVDIWRTQPDFAEAVRVGFPFPYGTQSPYIVSDPGIWHVWVTPTTAWADTLVAAGPIRIQAEELVTVFLLDSAGVLRMRVSR